MDVWGQPATNTATLGDLETRQRSPGPPCYVEIVTHVRRCKRKGEGAAEWKEGCSRPPRNVCSLSRRISQPCISSWSAIVSSWSRCLGLLMRHFSCTRSRSRRPRREDNLESGGWCIAIGDFSIRRRVLWKIYTVFRPRLLPLRVSADRLWPRLINDLPCCVCRSKCHGLCSDRRQCTSVRNTFYWRSRFNWSMNVHEISSFLISV